MIRRFVTALLLLAAPALVHAQTTRRQTVPGLSITLDPVSPLDAARKAYVDAVAAASATAAQAFVAAEAARAIAIEAGKQASPISPFTVFLGSSAGDFAVLANPAVVSGFLALGNVGLYQHANGSSNVGAAVMSKMRTAWGLPASGGDTMGEVGDPQPVGTYANYFGGRYPPQIAMNLVRDGFGMGTGTYTAVSGDAHPGTTYTSYTTAQNLVDAKATVDAAVAAGARSVAVFQTPNGNVEDIDTPFATSGYWANVRLLALYGGGLAMDVPPSNWVSRGPAYQSWVRQAAAWALGQHIRLTVAVSPWAGSGDAAGNPAGCGADPNFLRNTMSLAADLAATPPSSWVVESYCPFTDSRNTTNAWTVAGGPGTMNEVATWLASAGRTSPLGTVPAGASGVAEASTLAKRVRSLMFARDVPGLGGMAVQEPWAVGIQGGRIDGVMIGHYGRASEVDTVNLDVSGASVLRGGVAVIGLERLQSSAGTTTISFNGENGLGVIQNLQAPGSAQLPFASVPNSSSPCARGQFQFDGTFAYFCIAANTWRRAALGAF